MDILATLFPYFASKTSTSYVARDSNMLRRDNHISHSDRFDRYFNLDLSPGELKQSEIVPAAYYFNIHDLSQFLLEKDKEGASYKLLEEIRSLAPDLSSERAKTIITALVSTSAQLTDTKVSIFFPLDIQTLLKHLVFELLKRVDVNERLPFMTHIINNGNTQSFSALAYVLNTIELGYGRLAANGEENSRDKVISLDELMQLEDIFKQKVKSLLQENSLFIFDQWYIVSYLLECFDPNYIDGYLSKVLETDRNILEYICSSIGAWKGGTTEYEVKDKYKKYLTDGRILQAIESERDSGGLFTLSDDVQSKAAAFYIRKKFALILMRTSHGQMLTHSSLSGGLHLLASSMNTSSRKAEQGSPPTYTKSPVSAMLTGDLL